MGSTRSSTTDVAAAAAFAVALGPDAGDDDDADPPGSQPALMGHAEGRFPTDGLKVQRIEGSTSPAHGSRSLLHSNSWRAHCTAIARRGLLCEVLRSRRPECNVALE